MKLETEPFSWRRRWFDVALVVIGALLGLFRPVLHLSHIPLKEYVRLSIPFWIIWRKIIDICLAVTTYIE